VSPGINGASHILIDEDESPHVRIARLEARIDELSESLERCRKIRLFSQIAVAGGAIWIVAATLGAVGFDPVAMIAAISAVIGGVVGFGSNTTTTKEVAAAIKETEALRAELIAGLDLRLVGDRGTEQSRR
jgi:hypothetical protein